MISHTVQTLLRLRMLSSLTEGRLGGAINPLKILAHSTLHQGPRCTKEVLGYMEGRQIKGRVGSIYAIIGKLSPMQSVTFW